MPISNDFRQRLYPQLPAIAEHFGTPFHIYDEAGIRATMARLHAAFAKVAGFKEYYAVKALPNPRILALLRELGCGFDCSSIAELCWPARLAHAARRSCSPPTTPRPRNFPWPRKTAAAS